MTTQRGSGRTALESVAILLSGAAGATLFVYLLGGGVLWYRMWRAHVPANEAVALADTHRVLITGVQALIAPFVLVSVFLVLAGALIAVPEHFRRRKGTEPHEWSRREWVTNLAPLIAVAAFLTAINVYEILTFAVMLLVLLGWTRAERLRPEAETAWRGPGTRRMIAYTLVGALAIIILGQPKRSARLDRARVTRVDGSSIDGVYVATSAQAVYVGRKHEIVAVPVGEVRSLRIEERRECKRPARTLLDRILGKKHLVVDFEAKQRCWP